MTRVRSASESNDWLLSRDGAVALSAIALVLVLWGTFLDWHFVFEEFELGVTPAGLTALGYAAFFGGWIASLLAAVGGSRRGLMGLFVYAVLLVIYAIGDLIVYCPASCARIWLYYIANWSNLVLGLLVILTV